MTTPAQADMPVEVQEALERLRDPAVTEEEIDAAEETITAAFATAARQLAEAREWRFWVCEQLGLSCAAEAEWTPDEVVRHVADIETRAREAAERQLAEVEKLPAKWRSLWFGEGKSKEWGQGADSALVHCADELAAALEEPKHG